MIIALVGIRITVLLYTTKLAKSIYLYYGMPKKLIENPQRDRIDPFHRESLRRGNHVGRHQQPIPCNPENIGYIKHTDKKRFHRALFLKKHAVEATQTAKKKPNMPIKKNAIKATKSWSFRKKSCFPACWRPV
ncbi:hypothetical protein ACFS07_23270 [Undibacterium arcticum]